MGGTSCTCQGRAARDWVSSQGWAEHLPSSHGQVASSEKWDGVWACTDSTNSAHKAPGPELSGRAAPATPSGPTRAFMTSAAHSSRMKRETHQQGSSEGGSVRKQDHRVSPANPV